ncbi:A-kinase anchor protein 2 [Oryzias melastigma]|uniref:A-kinase anchor protein 2 n=2 Tax=Oryzias melastigma TaxID=30732 RepID=A0A834L0Z6_ORYME|nr:A-kinase anchor protein 2 [Oryzias melastigma]
MGSGTGDIFPSPCCPHRHHQELKFYQTNVAASLHSEGDSDVQNSPRFQEDSASSFLPSPRFSPFSSRKSTTRWEPQKLDYASSQSREPALDLIKKEIQEVLKREQELKEMRESRKGISRPLLSPASLVEKANMMAVRLFYPQPNKEKEVNLNSSSGHVDAPHPRTPSSRLPRRPPSLTEIPVQDLEEHQAELEESSYGGILLVDNINNKVIESTRVARHKNQRALRWEAGVFTTTET